tara:strand:- start:332 stop:514 length:183 start_codon:yes stop_codon:yes gene_type:complete
MYLALDHQLFHYVKRIRLEQTINALCTIAAVRHIPECDENPQLQLSNVYAQRLDKLCNRS